MPHKGATQNGYAKCYRSRCPFYGEPVAPLFENSPHYPNHSYGLKKHDCLSKDFERNKLIRSKSCGSEQLKAQNCECKPNDAKMISKSGTFTECHCSPPNLNGADERLSNVTRVSLEGRQDSRSSKDLKSGDNECPYEYSQFLLKITEDILVNHLYGCEAIEMIFAKHIEANCHRLDVHRMQKCIEKFKEDINFPNNFLKSKCCVESSSKGHTANKYLNSNNAKKSSSNCCSQCPLSDCCSTKSRDGSKEESTNGRNSPVMDGSHRKRRYTHCECPTTDNTNPTPPLSQHCEIICSLDASTSCGPCCQNVQNNDSTGTFIVACPARKQSSLSTNSCNCEPDRLTPDPSTKLVCMEAEKPTEVEPCIAFVPRNRRPSMRSASASRTSSGNVRCPACCSMSKSTDQHSNATVSHSSSKSVQIYQECCKCSCPVESNNAVRTASNVTTKANTSMDDMMWPGLDSGSTNNTKYVVQVVESPTPTSSLSTCRQKNTRVVAPTTNASTITTSTANRNKHQTALKLVLNEDVIDDEDYVMVDGLVLVPKYMIGTQMAVPILVSSVARYDTRVPCNCDSP